MTFLFQLEQVYFAGHILMEQLSLLVIPTTLFKFHFYHLTSNSTKQIDYSVTKILLRNN